MTNIFLILLFFAPGFYSGTQILAQEPDPEKANFGDELFSIDLVRCEPISKKIGWGLGYDKVEVKGKDKKRCIIRRITDWEADYIVTECRIKTSLKRLAIIKGPLFNIGFKPAIEGSCKVIKKGHQFPGDPDPSQLR
jgi:hypothetical protein